MSCNASNATVSALNATVAALLAQLGSTDTTTSGGEVLNGTQPAPPVASPSAFAHSELCAPLRAQRGPHGRHNVPWRIGASFLVFGCSVLGVAASLLGHHSPRFALSDYAICFARTFGTGILIAAALLHQLSVASLSLTSAAAPPPLPLLRLQAHRRAPPPPPGNCLAWEFNTDYQASGEREV